jgi:hypothetical protein
MLDVDLLHQRTHERYASPTARSLPLSPTAAVRYLDDQFIVVAERMHVKWALIDAIGMLDNVADCLAGRG